MPNCIYHNPDSPSIVMVGTTFLKLEEQVPSQGRLLMLDSQTLQLVQEFVLDGSVQSITYDQSKCLCVAVNNKLRIYTLT